MNKDHEATTVRLHRVLRAPADRIYRAFLVSQRLCADGFHHTAI